MKRYTAEENAHCNGIAPVEDEYGPFYLVSDADTRIAELEKALRGIMGYFTSGNAIPAERVTIKADAAEIVFAKSVL